MIWFTFTLMPILKGRISLPHTNNIYSQVQDIVHLFLSALRNKNVWRTTWLLLHLFLLWPYPNPLNSMNIKSGTTEWSRIVQVCLPLEVPLFDAVKGRPLSSGDGLPGLLMGCQIQGNMLSELRLSLEREWGAPVTSGHALLVFHCVSTTLRTHAGSISPSTVH